MNLQEILDYISDLDNASTPVAPEVWENAALDAGVLLRDKIDAIHTVCQRIDMEAERLSAEAKKFSAAATACRNNAARLEEWVLTCMRNSGFEKLAGNIYQVGVRKSKALEVERGATPADFLEMEPFVKRDIVYSWKKDEIKKALADGAEFPYGHIVERPFLKFDIKKGQA